MESRLLCLSWLHVSHCVFLPQVDLEEERLKKKAASLTLGQTVSLYVLRVFLNIVVLILIGATFYGIAEATQFSQVRWSKKTTKKTHQNQILKLNGRIKTYISPIMLWASKSWLTHFDVEINLSSAVSEIKYLTTIECVKNDTNRVLCGWPTTFAEVLKCVFSGFLSIPWGHRSGVLNGTKAMQLTPKVTCRAG